MRRVREQTPAEGREGKHRCPQARACPVLDRTGSGQSRGLHSERSGQKALSRAGCGPRCEGGPLGLPLREAGGAGEDRQGRGQAGSQHGRN